MWGPAIVKVRVVHPSVSHTRISPKLSKIDVRFLGKSNKNLGFLIQNLPSDSRSEIRFCRTILGITAGQLSSHNEWYLVTTVLVHAKLTDTQITNKYCMGQLSTSTHFCLIMISAKHFELLIKHEFEKITIRMHGSSFPHSGSTSYPLVHVGRWCKDLRPWRCHPGRITATRYSTAPLHTFVHVDLRYPLHLRLVLNLPTHGALNSVNYYYY